MTAPLTPVETEVQALSLSLRGPREAYHAEQAEPEWPELVGGDAVERRPFATRLRQARIQTAKDRPGLLRPLRVARAALAHLAWSLWGRLRTARASAARSFAGSDAGLWLAQALTLALCWMVWRQPDGNARRLARTVTAQLGAAVWSSPRWPEPESKDGD